MGKVTVKIPLVTWRDGRPRFIPGARLRELGLKGEDLKHPDGSWLTVEQAIAWSDERQKLVASLAARAPRQRRALLSAGRLTVGGLVEIWMQQPRFLGEEVVEGKKRRAPLAAATVRYYRNAAHQLELLDGGRIWFASADAVTGKTFAGLVDRIEVKHGLATARAVRAMLSAAYAWGRRHGKAHVDPTRAAELELPGLPPRVRYGSIAEMRALVAAADLIGRPDVGDAIMLGLWTAQRQNDRLALTDGQVLPDGSLRFRQHKTGAVVLIPQAPELAARLEAARARRRGWRVNYPHVVLDEVAKRPFEADWYRKVFRQVRAAAVAGIRGERGRWRLKPARSLADFRDQDLRDTAVTWLALAGVDKIRIASVTGHSLKSIDTILKHYLGLHPELARSAIASLVDWYEESKE